MPLTPPLPGPTSGGAATTHVRYRILALIASLSVLTYLDRICIQRVQPDIQSDLGLSDTEFGLVYSAFMVGYALFEMPVGWLSDVWGTRTVILRIVLWWSFFTALTGAIYNFFPESRVWLPLPWGWVAVSWGLVSMAAVRFLFGCGEAGVYPTLANVVRTWFPLTERGMAQGVVLMCTRLGAAISPLVIGVLSDAVGWRWSFVVLGFVGVVWTVLFGLVFRQRPADHPRISHRELAHIGEASIAKLHGGPPLPWREVLSRPTVWAMGILYVLSITFGWTFYITWQPTYLKEAYGLSFRDSQLWVGLPYLCGAAGCLLGGRLSDLILRHTKNVRWARSSVGLTGLAIAGICFLAASVATGKWETVALFSIAAFSSDLFLAPYWAAITDIGGRFTGTLAGFFNMSALLGGSVFATLIPWLRGRGMAWEQLLQMIACAWLTAAALWLIVDASRPLLAPDAPHLPDA